MSSKTHESYGLIQINKFSGNGQQFFGSDLVHSGGISLTISGAEKDDRATGIYYYPETPIIRVEMSYSQWIDAITSGMNTQGVPVTIKHIDGKHIPQINHVEDKVNKFKESMSGVSETALSEIAELYKIVTELKLTKKDKEVLTHKLHIIANNVSSNIEFVKTLFDEHVDKVTTQAKHEVANYMESKLRSLGLSAIENNNIVQLGLTQNTEENEY